MQYMKFCRRTEGIKAARGVFKQAREDTRCGYQAFVAAALMEYNVSKVSSMHNHINNVTKEVCKYCRFLIVQCIFFFFVTYAELASMSLFSLNQQNMHLT